MSATPEVPERRDWDFATDGELDGMYVETRLVHVKNGPSAGQVKPVVDFHVGLDDQLVTVWLPAMLRRIFREELQRRRKADFEPGERIKITPKGKRQGQTGSYWDFEDPVFEFAAPKPTAAAMLAVDEDVSDPPEPDVPVDDQGLSSPPASTDDTEPLPF